MVASIDGGLSVGGGANHAGFFIPGHKEVPTHCCVLAGVGIPLTGRAVYGRVVSGHLPLWAGAF